MQTIIARVNEICKTYRMEMNVKKTKTMVICKYGNTCCKIMVNGTMLEQRKYLGSWITASVEVRDARRVH